MKYKVLPHARVVMATDGSKQLYIDTGREAIPLNNCLVSTETITTVLQDATPMSFEAFPESELPAGLGQVMTMENPIVLRADATYIVTWDSTQYTCTPWIVEDMVEMVYIGNKSLVGLGDDTGEPFVFGYMYDHLYCMFAGIGPVGSHVVSISEVRDVIHPIDAKYIPDLGAVKTFNLSDYTEDENLSISKNLTSVGSGSGGWGSVARILRDLYKSYARGYALRVYDSFSGDYFDVTTFSIVEVDGVNFLCPTFNLITDTDKGFLVGVLSWSTEDGGHLSRDYSVKRIS